VSALIISHEEGVRELVIPDSVVFIGKAAFHRMSHINKAVVGSGITVIAELMFAGCDELEDLILPDTIKVIKNSAFEYCPIKKMVIPPKVIEIGANPFCKTNELVCLSENYIFEDDVLYSKDRRELIICNTKKKEFCIPYWCSPHSVHLLLMTQKQNVSFCQRV
jgi:hypothetical protein